MIQINHLQSRMNDNKLDLTCNFRLGFYLAFNLEKENKYKLGITKQIPLYISDNAEKLTYHEGLEEKFFETFLKPLVKTSLFFIGENHIDENTCFSYDMETLFNNGNFDYIFFEDALLRFKTEANEVHNYISLNRFVEKNRELENFKSQPIMQLKRENLLYLSQKAIHGDPKFIPIDNRLEFYTFCLNEFVSNVLDPNNRTLLLLEDYLRTYDEVVNLDTLKVSIPTVETRMQFLELYEFVYNNIFKLIYKFFDLENIEYNKRKVLINQIQDVLFLTIKRLPKPSNYFDKKGFLFTEGEYYSYDGKTPNIYVNGNMLIKTNRLLNDRSFFEKLYTIFITLPIIEIEIMLKIIRNENNMFKNKKVLFYFGHFHINNLYSIFNPSHRLVVEKLSYRTLNVFFNQAFEFVERINNTRLKKNIIKEYVPLRRKSTSDSKKSRKY